MSLWRIFRLSLRWWPLLVIPPVLGVWLSIYLTRDLPRVYSTNAVCSVGLFKARPRLSFSEETRPDYYRIRAVVDIMQSHLKQRETVARAALDLLAQDLEKYAADQQSTLTRELGAPPLTPLVAYIRDHGPVPLETTRLLDLAAAVRGWNPGKVVELNNRYSFDDDILAMLEDPRFPLSISTISRNLSTQREGETDLVRLSLRGENPALIYRFLNQLLTSFVKQSEAERRSTANGTLAFLKENVENARQSLANAEEALRQFNSKHGISNYYEQAKYLADQREKMFLLREEHRKKAEGLTKAIAEMEIMLGGNPRDSKTSAPVIDTSSQDRVLAKRKELARRQAEFDLNSNLGSLSPQALAGEKSRVDSLRRELDRDMDTVWSSNFTSLGAQRKDVLATYYKMVVDLETEKSMAEVADRQFQQFETEMSAFAPLGAELRRLEREVDLRSGEYLDLQREANKSRMAYEISNDTASIDIQQHPSFPVRPDASKRKYLVAGAGLIPAFGALLAVLGLVVTDPTMRDPQNAMRSLGVPVAGGLPRLSRRVRRRVRNGAVVSDMPDWLLRSLMTVGANVGGSLAAGRILLLPMRLGEEAGPCSLLLKSAIHELWTKEGENAGPSVELAGDPVVDPPVYASFSHYQRIVILWPMHLTPGYLEQHILDEVRRSAAHADVSAVVCSLDRQGYEEFFGERLPRLAGRFW